MSREIVVGLNAVILAVTRDEPRILTVRRAEDASVEAPATFDALPFGPLDPQRDRTLELGLRGWVREQTGLELGYVEQLYTFGDMHRVTDEREGGPRTISIGYLTLVREDEASGKASDEATRWAPWYGFFPWEDWRGGRPDVLPEIEDALRAWLAATPDDHLRRTRRERVDIAFGWSGDQWDGYRVLDRYELLYEAGLVGEAARDRHEEAPAISRRLGRVMAFDHRRILATALSRLRGKIKFRPVVFELLPPTFTLLHLQRVVEALTGHRLHKQNFRRLVDKGGLVEGTGRQTTGTGGRPAELFSFRREVLRERPTPGVNLPRFPRS